MTATNQKAKLKARMKSAFIVTHDYGTGGVLYRLFSDDRAAVERLFPAPTWNVFLEGDANCPDIPPNLQVLESDIDQHEDWLAKHAWSEKQRKLGRRPFWFEHPNRFKTRYFEVWAESELDVLQQYEGLKSMMLRVVTGEMMDGMIYCSLEDLRNHL
jgi:hypothetical protein